MKTPRIEEMVDEMFDTVYHTGEQPNLNKDYLRQALTEAHQAGVDDAVEKIKPFVKRVRLDVDVIICDCGEKYKDSDLDLSVGELEQALDDTIKALQDNK